MTTQSQKTKNVPAIVLQQDKDQYIKNPMNIVRVMGQANLRQSRIVIKVVERIQRQIREYLDHREERNASGQLSLFADDEFEIVEGKKEECKTFYIPLQEFGVKAYDYDLLEQAAKAMSSITVPVFVRNKRGDMEKRFEPLITCAIPPSASGVKRGSYMSLYVVRSVAEQHFVMEHGYSEHLRNIADLCSKQYLLHLLTHMYKWFREYAEKTVPYGELRHITGCDVPEDAPKGTKAKYPRFKDYEKRVLAPSKEDADQLFRKHKIDFTFEYDVIRPGELKQGKPSAIRFRCVSAMATPMLAEKVVTEQPAWLREGWQHYLELATQQLGQQVVDTWKSAVTPELHKDGESIALRFPTSTAAELCYEYMITPTGKLLRQVFPKPTFYNIIDE